MRYAMLLMRRTFGAAATYSLFHGRGLFGLLAHLRAGSSPKSGYGDDTPCSSVKFLRAFGCALSRKIEKGWLKRLEKQPAL